MGGNKLRSLQITRAVKNKTDDKREEQELYCVSGLELFRRRIWIDVERAAESVARCDGCWGRKW